MKSLLKYASIVGLVFITLSLTACGTQPNFDVSLDNGASIAIETDYFQLTNQEVFELVTGGYINQVNPGVIVILDWVDSIILADLVEIDESLIEEELSFIENFFSEEAINELLATQGFESLDAYFAPIRLELMREQAIVDAIEAIEIDPEEVEDIFNEFFVSDNEDDDDDDVVEDDESGEQLSDDEIRSNIENFLRNEIAQAPGFVQGVLANLRMEAGLTIYSSYFVARYENFLEAWMVEDVAVASGNSTSAVASIDDHYLTANELFQTATARFAFHAQSPFLNYIDLHVLNEIYNVERATIRSDIDDAKVNLREWFYPQMEMQGLLTEAQIFDAFTLWHLQDLAINDAFSDVSDERLQELYEEHIEELTMMFEILNTPERSVRHILINVNDERSSNEAREFAEELITQLQAANADEVERLFIELAQTYSSCASAPEGGDLGSFGPGRMVREFEEATFALELYEFTTEPVETIHGFHIIYLYDIMDIEDIEALDIPTFEQIRNILLEDETNRLRSSQQHFSFMMFGLRADQNIRFHHEQMQTQYDAIREQNRRSIENE